jgi:tetratricopeptide (TPR) repeat protein
LTWARKGNYEQAIADYDRALVLMPNFSGPYYNRARLEAICGRIGNALEWLARAIEKDAMCREYAKTEPDFVSLRGDSRFLASVGNP